MSKDNKNRSLFESSDGDDDKNDVFNKNEVHHHSKPQQVSDQIFDGDTYSDKTASSEPESEPGCHHHHYRTRRAAAAANSTTRNEITNYDDDVDDLDGIDFNRILQAARHPISSSDDDDDDVNVHNDIINNYIGTAGSSPVDTLSTISRELIRPRREVDDDHHECCCCNCSCCCCDSSSSSKEDPFSSSTSFCTRLCKYIGIKISALFSKENMASSAFVCGLFFDLFQIVLSISDVTTDILVTHEFYQEGHKPFFVLMICILSITSIASAIGFLIRIGAFRNEEDICSLLLVFPFALIGLLLPIANYVMSKFNCLPERARGNEGRTQADWQDLEQNLVKEDEREEKKKAERNGNIGVVIDEEEDDDDNENDNDSNDSSDKEKKKKKKKTTKRAVLQLFLKAVAPQQSKLAMVDKAITERVMTFLLLNLQGVTESMPGAITQIVAISILQNVTDIQIISLCLSLFSLACKSFIMCRSFEIKAFLAKISFLAFDLFSMAFVFSCLLATNTPRNVPLFFGLISPEIIQVNILSDIWIILKSICLFSWISVGITTWVRFYIEEIDRGERCNFFFWSFMGLLCSCLLLGPALIVEETMKLSWIVWFNQIITPPLEELPNASLLHEFVHDHGSNNNVSSSLFSRCSVDRTTSSQKTKVTESIDWRATFDFFRKKCIDDANAREEERKKNEKEWQDQQVKKSAGGTTDWRSGVYSQHLRVMANPFSAGITTEPAAQKTSFDALFQQCQRPLTRKQHKENADDNHEHQEENFYTRARHILLVRGFQKVHHLARVYPRHYQFRYLLTNDSLMSLAQPNVSSSTSKSGISLLDPVVGFRHICLRNGVLFHKPSDGYCDFKVIVLSILALTELLSTVFSLCFFFIYGITYITQLAIMQKICFYTACAALFFSAVLSPSLWRYFQTCLLYNAKMPYEVHTSKEIMTMINSYFSVPLATLQAVAVPNKAVPEECFEKHVLPFLTTKMVWLDGIALEEFEEMRRIAQDVVSEKMAAEEEGRKIAEEALVMNYGTITNDKKSNNRNDNDDDEAAPLIN